MNNPLTIQDFIFQKVCIAPNNAFLNQLLRFGYIHSVLLFAITHQLSESKALTEEKKQDLMRAKEMFTQTLQPFFVAFPVANAMAATTDLFEVLDTQRREKQMLR